MGKEIAFINSAMIESERLMRLSWRVIFSIEELKLWGGVRIIGVVCFNFFSVI